MAGEMEGGAEFTWPLIHKFKQPREALGESYDGITLREPTVADFLKHGMLDGGADGEAMLNLIADLSGVAQPVIKKFPALEYLALVQRLNAFLSQAAR